MENNCKKLREWVMKIVDFEMKEMIPLTNDENDYHEKQDKCFIFNKIFFYGNKSKDFKNYREVHDHCHYSGKYRGATHSICNMRYKTTKKVL